MTLEIAISCVVVLLLILFFTFVPVGLWISALAAGVKLNVFNLVGMRLRRVMSCKNCYAFDKGNKSRY